MEQLDSNKVQLTRRQLLVRSATASGGLALGFSVAGCASKSHQSTEEGAWAANAWIEVTPYSRVLFTLDRVEMGQGTYTGLTTLIAEELDQAPETITVRFAGADQKYRNPDYGLQITGGSNSLSSAWEPIRTASAAVREMLLQAASQVLEVNVETLTLRDGAIVANGNAQVSLPMGELVSIAATFDVPDAPKLKDKAAFKYIGKHSARLDAQAKVLGQATFGIDAQLPEMAYAVVVHPPQIGGRLKSFDSAAIASDESFIAVQEISSGIAVVATSYWSARKLSDRLVLDWESPDALISDDGVFALYRDKAESGEAEEVRSEGDVVAQFERAKQDADLHTVELEYEMPFLAHATMEPMNCLAHVKEDRADIWASTQGPDIAQVAVAKVTHLDLDQVYVHSQFLGGGFGRRLSQDFIAEAAEISKATGLAIKLVWSREDDMRNDFYRPATFHKLAATVTSKGELTAWKHHVVGPGVMDWYIWDAAPAMFPAAPKFMFPMLGSMGLATAGTPMTPADRSSYEGADDLEYQFGAQAIMYTKADAGVPVGYWRAVGHSHNGFVTETFMEVCAEQAQQDPVQFRLKLLRDNPRMANVLTLAAEKGGWSEAAPEGRKRGIAVHKSFGSYVAELVELSLEHGEIKVHKVVCVVDCGQVVNPDIVTMQMESGIVFGITAALYGEINLQDSRVMQSNFHDYQMLRANQCPDIEVHVVDSDAPPTGVGEPGLPPIAAAMASALYQATGVRHTRLPFKLS